MALLGKAAVAMWWDIATSDRSEFEDWHSHEHLPERMGIPGFCRGSRWRSMDGSEGFFVMYELDSFETLTSDGYFARLNAPTPWSEKMMPKHLNMIRSQCRVAESRGGGLGAFLATLRLSPQLGKEEMLYRHLAAALDTVVAEPGVTGAHFLRTETPKVEPTTEQRIRGGDGAADWIVLVSGYSLDAVESLDHGALGRSALHNNGAGTGELRADFRLSYSFTPQDLGAMRGAAKESRIAMVPTR